MKKLLLAAVATAVLSFPALAQQNPTPPTPAKQTQMNRGIQPQSLSHIAIRQIQEALNKDGFSSGHVDGVWGPDTRTALENFQKTKGMTPNGQLNNQTLAALNVKVGQSVQASASNMGKMGQQGMNAGKNAPVTVAQKSAMQTPSKSSAAKTGKMSSASNADAGKNGTWGTSKQK
jgi:peptidoglycan hydrolase-like protein with peptidoglycan-binding domain